MKKIAIIGAGFSGLTLAQLLSKNHHVTVFEKSYAPGGRLATRLTTPYHFDHGAQFFTAKTDEFKKFLIPLIKSNVITPWNAVFAELTPNQLIQHKRWDNHFPHYVGSISMKKIGYFISQHIKVCFNTTITSIQPSEKLKWCLHDNQQHLGHFDWVVTALPSYQASILLPNTTSYLEKLKTIKMSACFTLMLEMNQSKLNFDAALIKNADISWISVNSSKPNRPQLNSMVIHSTNLYADNNIDKPIEMVSEHLLSETLKITQLSKQNLNIIDIHRWKYANIKKQPKAHLMIDTANQIASCGDWCIEGKVEGAFLSAINLHKHLRKNMEVNT